MYSPPQFREDRLEVQHALIRAQPLAVMVTGADEALAADHVPFLLVPGGPLGTLQGHVARANPAARAGPALLVFQGPASYVTPSWYASKRVDGRVVPTWNYATVHVHGRIVVRDDAAWLHDQITALTRHMEDARAEPWAVDDAPEPFVASQIRGIVGIEIEIARIAGKWKISQNRTAEDRAGVVAGLGSDAPAMARLVADGPG